MTTLNAIQTKWAIDPMHSEVQFKIKHLMISTVTGSFKSFSGTVISPTEDFEDADIQFSLDVNSITTNQEMRDNHLKNDDFFQADKYPTIDFKSTSFKKVNDVNYVLVGNLTMKGVTKEIEVNAEFGGESKDHQGNLKAGFEVTGIINRKDFGLTYNALTETGGLALGENIKLIANLQVVKES
ncbi:MAG: YceI family protein [Bacteroidota bacterium]